MGNIFLDDFIQTLSTNQEKRIGTILANATLAKTQLDSIALQLSDVQTSPLVILPFEQAGTRITSVNSLNNLQVVWQQLQALYAANNLVALLLDSHASILGSDVKALTDEVAAMEKLAANYGFLLADGGAYSFAYLESFNDNSGRDTSLAFSVPDRAHQIFGPAEQAVVRTGENTLALVDKIDVPHTLSARVVKSNASASIVSDTGIDNVLNTSSTTGWRVVLDTPAPITLGIPEAHGEMGAQIIVEFSLSQPSAVNQITIVPFADMALEILSVKIFTSPTDDSTGVELLSDTALMDRDLTLHFPMQSIARFRVLLSQPTYNRLGNSVHPAEQQYQNVLYQILQRKKTSRHFGSQRHVLHTLRIMEILKVLIVGRRWNKSNAFAGLPEIDFDPIYGPLTLDKVLFQNQHQTENDWDNADTIMSDVVMRVFQNTLLFGQLFTKAINNFDDTYQSVPDARATNPASITVADFRQYINQIKIRPNPSFALTLSQGNTSPVPLRRRYIQPGEGPTVVMEPPPPINILDPTANPYQYTYSLGLKYVAVGADSLGFKGQFVSVVMPASGEIGEVRLKTVEQNYINPITNRDSDIFTSVEYSVTNVSQPESESDWIPICSIDKAGSLIEAERFFPDVNGTGFFRFPASLNYNIVIYKNGYVLAYDPSVAFVYANDKQSILGLTLPVGSYNSQDFLVTDYTPAGDFSTSNWTQGADVLRSVTASGTTALPQTTLPLVSASDNTGAGESFAGTSDQNTVTLLREPFIDYDAVATSTYSSVFGLTPYQPITVIFQDGSSPINLTNYIPGGASASLPITGSYYIQNGTIMMFNEAVTRPFRVYYQYLQNNVRVRVVLRCNDKNFVSPQVHAFHLKGKVQVANAGSNFT